eukprot:6191181-Pleurochrysis_carterae.AAC.1
MICYPPPPLPEMPSTYPRLLRLASALASETSPSVSHSSGCFCAGPSPFILSILNYLRPSGTFTYGTRASGQIEQESANLHFPEIPLSLSLSRSPPRFSSKSLSPLRTRPRRSLALLPVLALGESHARATRGAG